MERVVAARTQVFPQAVQPSTRTIIEGKHSDYQREDRQVKSLDIKLHQVTATFDTKDEKGMTAEVFEEKAREIGAGMGKQMWDMLFDAVKMATNETGNTMEIKNGEFGQEDILRMLDMTQHCFDDHGNPTNMLLLHPNVAEALKKREEEWARDHVFLAKLEEIKRRKKEEFDEREARRRLVD